MYIFFFFFFFFKQKTAYEIRPCDWSSDVCSSDLWAAARRLLLIAEPVRNVSQSRSAVARWLARVLTRTDDRVHTFRYTEATLLELYRRCGIPVSRLDRTPGGREVVVCSVKAP